MPFTVYPCPEFSAFLGFGPVKGPSKEVLVATHDVPYHGVETVAGVRFRMPPRNSLHTLSRRGSCGKWNTDTWLILPPLKVYDDAHLLFWMLVKVKLVHPYLEDVLVSHFKELAEIVILKLWYIAQL